MCENSTQYLQNCKESKKLSTSSKGFSVSCSGQQFNRSVDVNPKIHQLQIIIKFHKQNWPDSIGKQALVNMPFFFFCFILVCKEGFM